MPNDDIITYEDMPIEEAIQYARLTLCVSCEEQEPEPGTHVCLYCEEGNLP